MGLKIHELPADSGNRTTVSGVRKKKRRVGRGEGSGWGRTAGKGNKGVQARSGRAKGGAFEGGQTPLIRRVPKFGFSNAKFRIPRGEVTLEKLNRFEDGATVTVELLHSAGLITKAARRVKIIATGKLERKVTLKGVGCSAGAKTAIEAKGGSCEAVEQ